MTAPHLGAGHAVAGKYTIRSLIAFTGEVATYHAATQQGQDVVLKLYDPAIGQRADVMSRLEQVRAQVAALPPDISVPVIDSGYDVGTSAPFSVTELLRIHSLTQLVHSGPLAPQIVATILHGVARVLDTAHQSRLFHHALKPTNIFVGPAPHYPVRIADFGASVVRSSSPTHEAYANAAPWWAPEQLQPAAVLGAATDIFASALVAFYALTGRSYWMSCQSTPPDLPGWQIEIMGARTPVSQRATELGVSIAASADGVFARALSVNLLDRPRSVSEIANMLGGSAGMQPERGPHTVALPDVGYAQGAAAPQAAQAAALQGGVPSGVVTQQSGHTVVGDAMSPMAPGGAYAPAAQQQAAGGGYAAAGGAAGYAAAGGGYGQQPGGYAPAPAAAADPSGAGPEPATPGLPPYPHPVKKKKSGTMLPVIIGVGAAVVLGGIGVGFFLLNSGPETETEASAASSATAEPSAADSDASAKPKPAASSDPDEGEGGGGADDADAGTNEPDDGKMEVVLICEPKCDAVFVDNKQLKDLDEKLLLLPGKHVIKLAKTGYLPRIETIEVEEGKRFEETYKLVKASVRPAKPNPKPCGQFLRPCR